MTSEYDSILMYDRIEKNDYHNEKWFLVCFGALFKVEAQYQSISDWMNSLHGQSTARSL